MNKGIFVRIIFFVLTLTGLIVLETLFTKSTTPIDFIQDVLGMIFIALFLAWDYYDNLKNATPRQQYWDFMSFIGMTISGMFLLISFTGTM